MLHRLLPVSAASQARDKARREAAYNAHYQHGFPTMEQFVAWQEAQIRSWTGTPEAKARRAMVEAQLVDGWVPWHPLSDVFIKGDATPAPLNHLLDTL